MTAPAPRRTPPRPAAAADPVQPGDGFPPGDRFPSTEPADRRAAGADDRAADRGGEPAEPPTPADEPAPLLEAPADPLEAPHAPQVPPKWWSNPRSLVDYVLGLNDSAHRIALGVAVGMFWGMTPTVGVQMALVVGFYYLCKPLFDFNVKASLVTVYISNPLTMLAIYYFDYRVGALFVEGDLTKAELAAVLEYDGFADWWETVKDLTVQVGWPMLIGAVVVGAASALAAYPITRWLVVTWRGRRSAA